LQIHCRLPIVEAGDLKIVHAGAIMRYLARTTGGYGTNETERALCDMWDDQCEAVLQSFWNAEFMKNVSLWIATQI
jgi:glutathione S-transferase